MHRDPRVEALGPAERVVQTLLAQTDHMVHNRPGIVTPAPGDPIGVRWAPVITKEVDGRKVVYQLVKAGKGSNRVELGVLREQGQVFDARGRVVGEYRAPGLFPEVAVWVWRQIASVWALDNEFSARWASWAFAREHRDLKVALAAFMLVQSRFGEPVRDADGTVVLHDDDFRDVGEAMLLIRRKDGHDLNPKLLLRVGDLLSLPGVAAINRELGFGRSARNAPLGRWPKAVEKWLRHREANPKMLEGLVKAGFRTTVMALAQRIGYRPTTPAFFETLRWKQKQAPDGRRQLLIGAAVAAAESWADLGEAEICDRIVATRPSFKRIVGLVPPSLGLTRAIVAAAIEARSLSDTDLVILTPTLEDLGLLEVAAIKDRWTAAVAAAENQRSANIAKRVASQQVRDKLVEAADAAVGKAVAEVARGLRIYFFVDISASMTQAIESAVTYVTRLLGGFPLDKLHVAVFNTAGREVQIKHASSVGVATAFRGIRAGGGTDYGAGVKTLAKHALGADEDALFVFIGDEQASEFSKAVREAGLAPVAFGLLKVSGTDRDRCVRDTAANLGIPCFEIGSAIFDDPYAVPRTLRNLIAATPVGSGTQTPRVSLVETILQTDLLTKPVWAA
ncbi:MAG: VWA domain-containing protein [Myxococcota bacterium]